MPASRVSLPDGERRALLEFAIKQVNGRKPVIAHVSETGTGIAAALARHAEKAGATAIVATTPYYWTPPAAMVLEHFRRIGAAVTIPFFVYNAPEEMPGGKVERRALSQAHRPSSPTSPASLISASTGNS